MPEPNPEHQSTTSSTDSGHSESTDAATEQKEEMSKGPELPAIHEYSIRGILAAVHDEVDDDINAISEILGRSGTVLTDQPSESNRLPPQAEQGVTRVEGQRVRFSAETATEKGHVNEEEEEEEEEEDEARRAEEAKKK
ncbi:uncharacterized protein PV06_08291 [Exophiala oligosperma]|uniref:Uncharacterized protein n=1 Tax=Exophiala oligosperma TaxID=215243 RepID=A0A0D2BQ88_9EURO|nr:uncharacterized protein PV06_08291 [Exophiala oligosperma]KIW39702.1 hypothetical protein PV06_08291 [Exophiala oligosperma]